MAAGEPRRLGTAGDARLRFVEAEKPPGSWAGRRLLMLDAQPAFELSFWCGTCPFLFERLDGANTTLSLDEAQDRLRDGLDDVDDDVVETFGRLLGEDEYVPLLIEIVPTLVRPSELSDYFAHEQVGTWGVQGFSGLPVYPGTAYYRTFETRVSADAHLYEFVVPMVPPTWNDADRVDTYVARITAGARPTAVSVATLDVCEPATDDLATDYYEHWCLTHFLLDGHHKIEAAARVGGPITLLTLVAQSASLAEPDQLGRLVGIRSSDPSTRPAGGSRG